MPKPMPSEGSEENPFTPITKKPSMAGTEETKQELPDASDDSDAFDPRVLDGTLEEDAIYGDRTLPGGLKAPRATSLALRLAMRCAEGTEARRKAKLAYTTHVRRALFARGLDSRASWAYEVARDAPDNEAPRLANDAAFPARDARGRSLLMEAVDNWAAAKRERESAVFALLIAGAATDDDEGVLVAAAQKGCEAIVGALLDAGADPRCRPKKSPGVLLAIVSSEKANARCWTLVVNALASKHVLERVVGWRHRGLTALHYIALNGHVDIMRDALARKSFREAVDSRSSAAVAFDIRRVGDERFSGFAVRRTPLHFAVASSEVEIAELLLRAGADVQARDATGSTPLLECQGPFMLFALVLPCLTRFEDGGGDVSCFGGRPEKPPAEAEEKVPLEEALSQ